MNTSARAVDLRIGDRFLFDDQVLSVAQPPQVTGGLVEIWAEEWDSPFEGTDSTMVDFAVEGCPPEWHNWGQRGVPSGRANSESERLTRPLGIPGSSAQADPGPDAPLEHAEQP